GSRRWPVHVFYNVLDLAGINATIIYREVTGKQITRRDFLLQLSEELQLNTFMHINQKMILLELMIRTKPKQTQERGGSVKLKNVKATKLQKNVANVKYLFVVNV
ncbi:Uncharacterized protein FKW44_016523, partial [Caligus rogercresseyi]